MASYQSQAEITANLVAAKEKAGLTFEELGHAIGRSEVSVAAIFYGQQHASSEDITRLERALDLPRGSLEAQLSGFPDRGNAVQMPPKEPLIYRLYEIVQNYGQAYKAIMNEKFGDGIMSAIAFSTKVDKEVDEQGNTWVNITMRGKW
ncbi:hypothetical protein ABW19_dt0206752 [Dactylella cylindrospora]|nr:hypothetical protein ABW19_dt0206752 [Dactylella cylindrospora]